MRCDPRSRLPARAGRIANIAQRPTVGQETTNAAFWPAHSRAPQQCAPDANTVWYLGAAAADAKERPPSVERCARHAKASRAALRGRSCSDVRFAGTVI
jgi:hypothetical protein